MRTKTFRTRYLVYPRFQLALIFANVFSIITCSVITMLFLDRALSEMTELGVTAGFDKEHVYFRFLEVQSKSVYVSLMAGALATIVISSVFFVWFSHRLVGPVLSVLAYLKVVQGNKATGTKIQPLHFRRDDFFPDLADALNDVLKTEEDFSASSKTSKSGL